MHLIFFLTKIMSSYWEIPGCLEGDGEIGDSNHLNEGM